MMFLSCRNDGQDFNGSIHQKVNPDLETGVTLGWSAGSNATSLNFGAKYNLSADTNVRMKVNNQSQVGLSLQQKLKDGKYNRCVSACIALYSAVPVYLLNMIRSCVLSGQH